MLNAPRQDLLLSQPAVFGNSRILPHIYAVVNNYFYFFMRILIKKYRKITSSGIFSVN